ncbi:hypothetical protein ATY41_06715 [Leifsonia xyli subsp. xyli]|uniref:Uncharacterized protein n=2 Tax=Leifsonia xyli subsp. xyli TaxID=59736 RepID=Q6AFX6_LEIXX|nr:hypothetical protein [Leifsonia xyli]AAT88719.1 conserved hypothetical protein [Leifsonia xyli subsp. xyli str. CTCB07]ODA91079.1 hypothetical protein ATY41_06715 [Leifsonia xyli subsp. xyli]
MTLWPDHQADADTPPRTRRQVRENERTATHRAGASTPAGESAAAARSQSRDTGAGAAEAPFAADEQPTIPPTAFAAGGFESLLFRAEAAAESEKPVENSFGLFRQASAPEESASSTRPVPVMPPANEGGSSGERRLTRRELRAMLQAQEANQHTTGVAPSVAPAFPVTFTPDLDAVRPIEPAAGVPPSAPAASGGAMPSGQKAAWPFAAPEAETSVTASPVSPFTAFGAQVDPGASRPVAPAAPAQTFPSPGKLTAPESGDGGPAAAEERRPFTPPTGHWSAGTEFDEKNEPVTTRNVAHSAAATTTNALILPSLPKPDATLPLTSTGEILVTGSIDLPRALGATGAMPDRIDSSDIDRLLDGEENEFNTSDSAPILASRAISSHTSTRSVIPPPKKRGNALPVVLMITAGVLAVGVLGLLITAYALNMF